MIDITVTIKTVDGKSETTMSKTHEGHSDNPLHYARYIRECGPALLGEMASRMASLHGDVDQKATRSGGLGAA